MKPMVLMIGADKGGVGKTTIARTLLDYLAAKNTLARAFDSEFPRGTLKRLHPGVTEIVNITTAADQIKILDTLTTRQIKVSVIDIRAGLLSSTFPLPRARLARPKRSGRRAVGGGGHWTQRQPQARATG
jgi:hypothetical protein